MTRTCPYCHHAIRLRASDNYDTQQAVIFNHEGACRNKREAERREAAAIVKRHTAHLAKEAADNTLAITARENLRPYQWQGADDLERSHHKRADARQYTSLRSQTEATMPTPKPARLLCLSCSEASAKSQPWDRQHWEETGHAFILSTAWERRLEDGVQHDYSANVEYAAPERLVFHARTPMSKAPASGGNRT